MRYDIQVTFWDEGSKRYNPETHKHEIVPKKLLTVFANVTDLGIQRQVELLGGIDEGTKTVRMMSLPPIKYDYIMIDGFIDTYRFISSPSVQKGYAMIVGIDSNETKN